MKEDKVFEFLPVEGLIKENQIEYYKVLEKSDAIGESTLFIEFSLNVIHKALVSYAQTTMPLSQDCTFRLKKAAEYFKERSFSRKEYCLFHKNISTATGSRDLLEGVQLKILTRQGEKNQTIYKFC